MTVIDVLIEEGKKVKTELYQAVLSHLVETGQGFCFVDGKIWSRQDCQEFLKQEVTV